MTEARVSGRFGSNESGRRTHDEDRIAKRVQQVKRPCAPLLIVWSPKHLDLWTPFFIVRVHAVDLERDTRVPPVPFHRAIDAEVDTTSRKSNNAIRAIVRGLERDTKPKLGNVEVLGDTKIVAGWLWYGSFHVFLRRGSLFSSRLRLAAHLRRAISILFVGNKVT